MADDIGFNHSVKNPISPYSESVKTNYNHLLFMKLLYKTSLGLMLTGIVAPNLMAQTQIPNSDFEGEWVNCVPWTFYGSDEVRGELSAFVVDKNPTGWIISNVSGMTSVYEGNPSGLGATVVGSAVEGYESKTAVKLTNNPNPFMESQIVPGYITLGTSWSTANPAFDFSEGFKIIINNSDGGAFGGVAFTERPTGLEFMYKRSRGTDKPAEKSTVVAYLWKGHWTQKNVPSIIYMAGDPVCKDMVDRDRCILGMETPQGGEVTKTDDAELIAVLIGEITEDASEWTKFTGTFEYKSDATPEMINIIIAAGDYFGGADVVGKDNSITVDNVNLLYAESAEKSYPGYLNIEMNGGNIATDQASTIKITKTGDHKCDFLLPNLTLTMGGSPMPLGDINLKDVDMTTAADGVTTYKGSVKDMSLMGGAITADVDLNGTTDAQGVANMKISVMWSGIPINVTFTTNPASSGIDSIAADENAPVEYFNLQGIKIAADHLTPGLYIKRQGKTVSKVILK